MMTFVDFGLFALVAVLIIWLVSFAWSSMTLTFGITMSEASEGAGLSTSAPVTVSGDHLISATPVIPAATSNVEVQVGFVVSRLKALWILSDKDVTIETNNSATPDDTLTITANKPWVWYDGSGITCPIVGAAGVVTKLFINNAGAADATVKIRGCDDVTP